MDTKTVSFRLSGDALNALRSYQRPEESLSKTALQLVRKLLGVERSEDVARERLEAIVNEELQQIKGRLTELETQVHSATKTSLPSRLTPAQLEKLRLLADKN